MCPPTSLEQIKDWVADRGKIAFVSGKFNVIHPGHLRLLRFAREISDCLVVGIYPDGYVDGLFLSEKDRLEGIQSNNWVDAAFILEESPETAISVLRPDVVVKGKEYEFGDNPETEAVKQYGGIVRFVSGD
ncbi:uncharacterized protein METZ01_LOCUS462211, partial [marine metagenome]